MALLKTLAVAVAMAFAAFGLAQINPVPKGTGGAQTPNPVARKRQVTEATFREAEKTGVSVRLKDIARFRGIRSNSLTGIGLVLGLQGTGDTRRVAAMSASLANYLRRAGLDVDPRQLDVRNVALVTVTAELPPFAVNGQKIDITVTSIGDATSLRNGTLLFTELRAPGVPDVVYATAQGAVSVGGFSVGQNGNQAARNHTTVGLIPGGGVVERSAPTTVVRDGRMSLELDYPDITTASRIEGAIRERFPEFNPIAINGGTIQVDLPAGLTPNAAMARLEELEVSADTPALVVVNEKTGTIVMGGSVRLAPCAIANGNLNVRIEEQVEIVQPAPFSQGQTAEQRNTSVKADEETAQIAIVRPNTTVADLASIFQALKLRPGEIITILQALHRQGALKARLVIQ